MLPIGKPLVNKVKARLKNGEKLLGAWTQLCSPMSAEIMARAGFDFVCVDMEHAPGDHLTLMSQLQAMAQYEALPVVRIPWNDFVDIKRTLDVGALGIHVPYVNTAEEAEAVVRAIHYPPLGIRGIAGSPRACGYGQDGPNYYMRANDEILLLVALETRQSVDNLDEILKIERIDGIFIGPFDMAASLGHVGNPGHPEVQKIIREIEAKVIGSGKFLGTVANGYDGAVELFDRGYQYLLAMSDSTELMKQTRNLAEKFKTTK